MSEQANVVNINGKEYDADTFSNEQNYLVAQLKDLQITIEQSKFQLDRHQAAFDVFLDKLLKTLETTTEQVKVS